MILGAIALSMNVLITGAAGRVGSAILERLYERDDYNFTLLDLVEHPEYETDVADLADYEEIRPSFENQDAVVHLGGQAFPDTPWEDVLEANIIGTRNVLKAACAERVEKVAFASTIRTVYGYERDNAPEIYFPGHDVIVDHDSSPRPDSYYAVSKLFGEDLGRYFVEQRDAPSSFYAMRLGTLRTPEYDHPYSDAERAVERGEFEPDSEEYERTVARQKAMWLSRRDIARAVDTILQDESVTFDYFYMLSGNSATWIDLEYTKEVLGFEPVDDGDGWDATPEDTTK